MSTIEQIRIWNTTPHARYEIINVNFSLPQGVFTSTSQLTQLAASNPIGDGSDYTLQLKTFGSNHLDGSLQKVTAWFAVRIDAGERVNTGTRGNDRYPYTYLKEKIVDIVDTGGTTVTWSPDDRYYVSNNAYGLLNASGEPDQSTSMTVQMKYRAKEMYDNFNDNPTEKTVTFKPLQTNIDGNISDAEEIDTDTVGSQFVRAWLTRVRYYPENNGGTVREPTLWAWLITEIPTIGVMSKFWLQKGFGEIRDDNNKRNNGNDMFVLMGDFKCVITGPQTQYIFEDHKLNSVSNSVSSGTGESTAVVIGATDYVQMDNVQLVGQTISGTRVTDFTFPQPHGLTDGDSIDNIDVRDNDTSSFDRFRYISEVTGTHTIRATGKSRSWSSTKITAVKNERVLFHNTATQVNIGFMFFYPNPDSSYTEENNTFRGMLYENGDHPLMSIATKWPDNEAYCAYGAVRPYPSHYADNATAQEDVAIVCNNQFNSGKTRDPWQVEVHGGAPRTGVAGSQPEFGASKCGHLARAGCPDTRTLQMDMMQEGCRLHHYRESDATVLDPRRSKYRTNTNVYSDVVFFGGRCFTTSDPASWQNQLGENHDLIRPAGTNCPNNWLAIQNLHWAANAMSAGGHLVADRLFRHGELKDLENVHLLAKPKPSVDIFHFAESLWGIGNADRSETRWMLTASQIYRCTGNDDIPQRFEDRIDHVFNLATNLLDAEYDPDKVSSLVLDNNINWGGGRVPTNVSWMVAMVHHAYAAYHSLMISGRNTAAEKVQKMCLRLGRSAVLHFTRKNSQSNDIWQYFYYNHWNWFPNDPGIPQDPINYPDCWIAASGSTGVSRTNPLTGHAYAQFNHSLTLWGIATAILLWEIGQSDSTLTARVHDMLAGSGTFIPDELSEERKGQSGWGKTWGNNFDDWISVINDPYKTRTLNGANVDANTVISSYIIFEPTVNESVEIKPDLVTSTFEIFDPTVGGGVTVSPATLVSTYTIPTASVVTIVGIENQLTWPFEIFEPDITAGINVEPKLISPLFNIFEPTITTNSVIVVPVFSETEPNLIVSTFEIFEPTIGIGVNIEPDLIVIETNIIEPKVQDKSSVKSINIEGKFIRRFRIDGKWRHNC